MKILDLFCGAGGVAMGLHRAWPDAEIVGVDIEPQPRYPFTFVLGNAMTYPLDGFDFIWASPPCQAYSSLRGLGKQSHRPRHDYIAELRTQLINAGCPFTIENVPGAPLINPVTLCGQFFGLGVRRHRKFESNFSVAQPDCRESHKPNPIAVYGDHPEKNSYKPGSGGYINRAHTLEMARDAMGIDWMNWKEITQAIPPVYSEYIARQVA